MIVVEVLRREFTEHVRKRSFIVSTVLVPVMMIVFTTVPILLSLFEPHDQYKMTILDHTGEVGADFSAALRDTMKSGKPKYLVEAVSLAGVADSDSTRERVLGALKAERLDIVLEIDEKAFSEGIVNYITRDVRGFQVLERFEELLTDVVMKRRLARDGLDFERVKSLTTRVRLSVRRLTATGEIEKKSVLGEWAVVFGFVMILYMALLTWGLTISRSILEEKGSRVVEVLLSSIEPRDLLLGKILGVGLAGLTQLFIWALAGFAVTGYVSATILEQIASIQIAPVAFVYFIVYFILGFVLYSSIFTVVGAMCSNEQDAQQLQGLVTMPLIIPILVLMMIVQSPNSTLAVVMSLIPLFTPMIMLGRIIVVQPPWWQVALGMGLMVASIWLSVLFSARIFRVGILMYGKRPNVRELIRWYRSAGTAR